jgi:hypothetical protein
MQRGQSWLDADHRIIGSMLTVWCQHAAGFNVISAGSAMKANGCSASTDLGRILLMVPEIVDRPTAKDRQARLGYNVLHCLSPSKCFA